MSAERGLVDPFIGESCGRTTGFPYRMNVVGYGHTMTRDEALCRLRLHEAELRRLGVVRLYMFGSTARDAATEESDVDLFFDYERGHLGVFELMDVKEHTANILGRKADVMTRDSLHRTLRSAIEASALLVF